MIDGTALELPAGKERALLSRLLVDANRIVSVDQLLDDLWDGNPSEAAAASLRVHVSRVRKALASAGADAIIVTRSPGYVLETAPEAIDALRFETLVESARSGSAELDPAELSKALREALTLWRGPALAEIAVIAQRRPRSPAARRTPPDNHRRSHRRRPGRGKSQRRHRRTASAGADAPAPRAPVGATDARAVPHRATGRRVADIPGAPRRVLADEVGLDPSPALCRLEATILAHDPSLDWSPTR